MAEEYTHTVGSLFKLSLDLRKKNNLDIYSHHLSLDANRANGFMSSTLALPNSIGNFRTTTKSIFIYIDPGIVNLFSENDWAFFIGHEYAHLLLAETGLTGKELELKCDIESAKYAIGVGYNLSDFLVTLAKFGNSGCDTHGCPAERAQNIKKHFGK